MHQRPLDPNFVAPKAEIDSALQIQTPRNLRLYSRRGQGLTACNGVFLLRFVGRPAVLLAAIGVPIGVPNWSVSCRRTTLKPNALIPAKHLIFSKYSY